MRDIDATVNAVGNAKRTTGWAILQSRSLPAAALFFFVLLDEIEGLVFVSLSVLAGRMDLFIDAQSILFPGAVFVSGVATGLFFWRRRDPVIELSPEPVSADVLIARIGRASIPAAHAVAGAEPDTAGLWEMAAPPTEAKWRRALR